VGEIPTVDASDPLDWYRQLARRLLESQPVHTGEWQSIDTNDSPMHATYELQFTSVISQVPAKAEQFAEEMKPNLPWAEEHFLERVSGFPHNPPPSHKLWPWARHNVNHQDDTTKFSHTYPERFWPKHSGDYWSKYNLSAFGIRYKYGDLNDVVSLLASNPLTRQAYLPVWFPEDTGNVSRVRVPCTLGYHFMIRDGKMHCQYPMRSCDLIRHLRDDVYMAGRLMQWMCDRVNGLLQSQVPAPAIDDVKPGTLCMVISSLHAFVGDKWKLENIVKGNL
jgi:thymidylate synthase-like protein